MGNSISLSNLSQSILKTLLYYDIFSYPLTTVEIFQFLPTNHVSLEDVHQEVGNLADQEIIHRVGNFFSIQNDELLSVRRTSGNNLAAAKMEEAIKRAAFIGSFPYVRAVMISGSLSKGYMDEKSDLDFFIITQPGKLWTARTLMALYKRIFLRNSHKTFCVNYFVDLSHLEIEEKNIFTATELATLIPACNTDLYHKLMDSNLWIASFFPNYHRRATSDALPEPRPWLKGVMETMLNLPGSRLLDDFFRDTAIRRWKKLYKTKYSQEDFDVAFKTKTYASKNHPHNYQGKVIALYEQKLGSFTSLNNSVPA